MSGTSHHGLRARPTPLAAALLLAGLGTAGAQVSLEPELESRPARSVLDYAPGTSALDAWAALREAEERVYSLPGTGLRTFAARVHSPQLDRLASERAASGEASLQFLLFWQEPDRRRVSLSGTPGALEPALASALTRLVDPLHELLFPVAPTRRLRSHAFVFAEGSAQGRPVIEARARDLDDPRRLARFTLDAEGAVVREESETAAGDRSDYHYAYARSGHRLLLVGVTGRHRGARVDLTIHWGAEVGGRPVPTRVTARQLDGLGQPQGPVPEIDYRLSGHRLDEPLPDWVWATSAPRPQR